ncbi:MAG: hypothetical protein EXR75_15775 [Myxococcales bacterium]|nr:hypothetical protein [Myxococcales bacterium]
MLGGHDENSQRAALDAGIWFEGLILACSGGELTTNVAVGAGGSESCPAAFMSCEGACIDAVIDPENCGACNTVCGSGAGCSNGMCGLECQLPLCQRRERPLRHRMPAAVTLYDHPNLRPE